MQTLRVHNAEPARRAGRAFKHWFSLFHVLTGLLACLALGHVAPLSAQPTATPTEPSSDRYLLILDTSHGMEPRQRAMLKTVQELLKSGMGGQMKAGDTLGVWTYNAVLYAGRFPLQQWSPGTQKAITSRVVAFLKGQKFENLPVLDNVLPALDGVVRNSHLITVILITSGDGLMQGTPFDHRINEFWQRWHDKQKTAKMPFVVVLRARDGGIKDYTLNLPPWPVQMPLLPAETQVAAAPPQPAAPQAPPRPQPEAAQPLVISGRKTKPLQPPKVEEAPTTKSQPSAVVVTNEPPNNETPAVSPAPVPKVEAAKAEPAQVKPIVPVPAPAPASNAPPAVKADQPKPPAPVAETAKAEPKTTPAPKPALQPPPAQSPPVAQPATPPPAPGPKAENAKALVEELVAAAPTQPPAPLPPPAPKAEPAKAPEPKPAQPASAQVATAPLPPPPSMPAAKAIEPPRLTFGPKPTFEPGAAPAPATIARTAVPAPAPGNQATTAPPTTISPPQPRVSPPPARAVAATPAITSSAPEKKPEPPPATSPSREVAIAPSTTATNADSGLAFARSNTFAASASPAAPVQAAAATPAESFLSQKTTWIAGVLLLAAAAGFGWLALRRSRATPGASLITRSLDRGKKP